MNRIYDVSNTKYARFMAASSIISVLELAIKDGFIKNINKAKIVDITDKVINERGINIIINSNREGFIHKRMTGILGSDLSKIIKMSKEERKEFDAERTKNDGWFFSRTKLV